MPDLGRYRKTPRKEKSAMNTTPEPTTPPARKFEDITKGVRAEGLRSEMDSIALQEVLVEMGIRAVKIRNAELRALAEESQTSSPAGRYAWDSFCAADRADLTPWQAFQAGLHAAAAFRADEVDQ